MVAFVEHIFTVDEELRIFGSIDRELTLLEREGIKTLRREQSKYEKSLFEK